MSLSLQEGRQEGGRTQRQTLRGQWAGLLGTTCAHVRPGGCRREAGAAVARARKAVLEAAPVWPAAGGDRGGGEGVPQRAAGGCHYLVPGRPSETVARPLVAAR